MPPCTDVAVNTAASPWQTESADTVMVATGSWFGKTDNVLIAMAESTTGHIALLVSFTRTMSPFAGMMV